VKDSLTAFLISSVSFISVSGAGGCAGVVM
jgi:hypothetical protein